MSEKITVRRYVGPSGLADLRHGGVPIISTNKPGPFCRFPIDIIYDPEGEAQPYDELFPDPPLPLSQEAIEYGKKVAARTWEQAAQPEPEGERRTVYMNAIEAAALRRGALIPALVTTSQREGYSEPATLILPPEPQPRTRFCVIEHSGEGDFTVWDNEAGRPAWEVPPDYPGGARRAATAERNRLNELAEKGEINDA